MIRAFRLCKTKHAATAFTGEGARIAGGRWNSPGVAVVYASSSLSLATLEVLVHIEDPEAFARLFSWFAVEIPDELIEVLEESKLPPGWCADETTAATQVIGDAWIRSQRSAVLAVPSVVTPGEKNYLLDPAHPRFSAIRIAAPQPFRPDPRLAK
ncbi:MAG TPA: RES family NAD+ phosphorylase [Haloferula sp.]